MAVSLREVVSFGRYEPLFRIASGGMAEVYAARIRGEAGFQKLVAVKRMHPHLAHDQVFVDMFLNEARLAAHIASPHVVQTLDLGRGSDGSLYIVMELVVGLSLAALEMTRKKPLPVPIALELLAQAAQGLDDAHEATTPAGDELGLIHRDVSPHNILLGIDGRARVTDFGIARAVHAPRAETNVKELKGKFAYMSPEQTRMHALDRRSDLFSVGVVLWEALVARRLFAERDAADCIRNVRRKVVPPPHELNPRVPPAVSEVVLRSLERMPSARFQTGAQMAAALRQVGRDELGGLPDRKAISKFVKQTGGEELDRLTRLIRLGTEGAAEEEMEAVRPGSTMVLGEDGSGVARIGTRTDEMDPNEAPKIATVILPPEEEEDEDFRLDTETDANLDSADLIFLEQSARHTAVTGATELPELVPTDDETDATDEVQTEEPRADQTDGQVTRPYARALPKPAPPPHDAKPVAVPTVDIDDSRRPWMLAGSVAAIAAVAAVALGLWITLREEPRRVQMPDTTARVPAPPPPELTPPARDPEAPPTTEASAEAEPARSDEPPVAEPPRAPEAPPERDAPPIEAAADVPDRPAGRRSRRRRARRGRSTTRETSEPEPVLLGVDAFDQTAP